MFIFGRIRDGEVTGSKKVFVYHIKIFNEDMRHMLMAQSYVPGALTLYLRENHIEPRFVVHVCPHKNDGFQLEVYEHNKLILKDDAVHKNWTSPLVTAYSLLEKKSKEENPESVFIVPNE